jgi:hypothetical protein
VIQLKLSQASVILPFDYMYMGFYDEDGSNTVDPLEGGLCAFVFKQGWA